MSMGKRRCLTLLSCVTVAWTAAGQDQGETIRTPASPQISSFGVLFTDDNAGTLYLERDGAAVC